MKRFLMALVAVVVLLEAAGLGFLVAVPGPASFRVHSPAAGTYVIDPDFSGNVTATLSLTETSAPVIGNVTFWFAVNTETLWTFQLTHFFNLSSVHYVLEWTYPTFHIPPTNFTFISSYATAQSIGWTSQTQEWAGATLVYNATGAGH